MGLKILLTGATGLLGREVESALRQAGHEVVAPSSSELDITVPAHLESVRRRDLGQPDWIINCAAYTAVDQAESEPMAAMRLNAVAPGALAFVAKQIGAEFVHFSTDFVFDGTSETPYLETSPPNPLSIYGKSKLQGEQNALNEYDRTYVLRTSWLYGVGGLCFPAKMIERFESGDPLRVVNDQTGRPTCAVDLAAVTAEFVGARPSPGIYHACGPGMMTWFDFAKLTLDTWVATIGTERAVELDPVPSSEFHTPARRPGFSVLDTTKLEHLALSPMRATHESLVEYCAAFESGRKVAE